MRGFNSLTSVVNMALLGFDDRWSYWCGVVNGHVTYLAWYDAEEWIARGRPLRMSFDITAGI